MALRTNSKLAYLHVLFLLRLPLGAIAVSHVHIVENPPVKRTHLGATVPTLCFGEPCGGLGMSPYFSIIVGVLIIAMAYAGL